MGTFYHEIQLFSANSDRSETVDALVNTGASYSQVPGSVLRRLGISPTDTAEAELDDGRVVEYPIAEVRVEINGRASFTWVTFGPENVASLLGAHALEGARMAVDPVGLRLIPARILRLRHSS